ncbi:MAG: hypothetical protein LBK53_09495 [Heliobacteriaceae bacterium]|jgi:hypothetical protein|nr:hypothetical protein [Heliobacteriaceae bacterium]
MKIINRIITEISNAKKLAVAARKGIKSETDSVEFSKNMTKREKLKTLLKPFILGLDKQTVKSLHKIKDKMEFVKASSKVILEKKGIPEGLRPAIGLDVNESLPPAALACYSKDFNMVIVSPKVLKKPKSAIFSASAHELKHFAQNIDIIRTEGLGEKAVKSYAKVQAEAYGKIFDNTYQNMSMAEIQKLYKQGVFSEQGLQVIAGYKKAQSEGEAASGKYLKMLYEGDFANFHAQWKNIRQKAADSLGIIKKDSPQAALSERHLNEFNNTSQDEQHYWNSSAEKTAYAQGLVAQLEYLWRRFF